MPEKIDDELSARAVGLVMEHAAEYPTTTAAVQAVAPPPAHQRGHLLAAVEPFGPQLAGTGALINTSGQLADRIDHLGSVTVRADTCWWPSFHAR